MTCFCTYELCFIWLAFVFIQAIVTHDLTVFCVALTLLFIYYLRLFSPQVACFSYRLQITWWKQYNSHFTSDCIMRSSWLNAFWVTRHTNFKKVIAFICILFPVNYTPRCYTVSPDPHIACQIEVHLIRLLCKTLAIHMIRAISCVWSIWIIWVKLHQAIPPRKYSCYQREWN